MKELRHLSIRASPGLAEHVTVKGVFLPLGHECFPTLQSLQIENCVVSMNLLKFMESHLHTLSDFVLKKCFVCLDRRTWYGDMPIRSWAQFFDGCSALQASALTKFVVEYDDDNLKASGKLSAGNSGFDSGLGEVFEAYHRLRAHTEQRIFPYARVNHRLGNIHLKPCGRPSPADIIDDVQSYERLQNLVESNAARISQENRENDQV